jgi:hypothetical protein
MDLSIIRHKNQVVAVVAAAEPFRVASSLQHSMKHQSGIAGLTIGKQ